MEHADIATIVAIIITCFFILQSGSSQEWRDTGIV